VEKSSAAILARLAEPVFAEDNPGTPPVSKATEHNS
jgi:hypothetical protein